MDEKLQITLFYPTRSALTKHKFFRWSKLKICNNLFSPCIDEYNKKKNRNKIGEKNEDARS